MQNANDPLSVSLGRCYRQKALKRERVQTYYVLCLIHNIEGRTHKTGRQTLAKQFSIHSTLHSGCVKGKPAGMVSLKLVLSFITPSSQDTLLLCTSLFSHYRWQYLAVSACMTHTQQIVVQIRDTGRKVPSINVLMKSISVWSLTQLQTALIFQKIVQDILFKE